MSRNLLEGADIHIPIVEPVTQLRHILIKKTPILANTIAAQRRSILERMALDKIERFNFGLTLSNSASLDLGH